MRLRSIHPLRFARSRTPLHPNCLLSFGYKQLRIVAMLVAIFSSVKNFQGVVLKKEYLQIRLS